MAKKLYVGNLPYEVTSQELETLFSQHGTVTSATAMTDRETGRGRGFGFVEMANDDEAAKAIETLNGFEFNGRKLVVNEARPMEKRDFGGNRGGGYNNDRQGGGRSSGYGNKPRRW